MIAVTVSVRRKVTTNVTATASSIDNELDSQSSDPTVSTQNFITINI